MKHDRNSMVAEPSRSHLYQPGPSPRPADQEGTPVNAQTQRIREALSAREPLATARGRTLGQIVVCEGCCCGQTDKGFKPVPRDWIKQLWKDEKLNKSVQLTISGCLGPCDLANVLCVISPEGMRWLGGLQEQWQYDLLPDWANASRDAGVLMELPAELNRHRFERFAVGYGSLKGPMATGTPSSEQCERGQSPANLPTRVPSGGRPDRWSERGRCFVRPLRRPFKSSPIQDLTQDARKRTD